MTEIDKNLSLEGKLPLPSERVVTPIGDAAMAGATWLMLYSILAQVLAFVARIAVTRFLSQDDVGLASLALSSCSFLAFLQPAVMGDVLVQRQRHFTRWANSAFWMSFSLVVLVIVAGLITAPIAGWVYHNAMISYLIVIGTLGTAFGGFGIVWSAQLSTSLKFRKIAIIGTVGSLVTTLLTIAMAAGHCGTWSLVVPATVGTLLALILYFRASSFRPHGRMHFRRWRFLLGDSLYLSVAGFFANLTMQTDNLFVGKYKSVAILGVYATAYTSSFQFVQLLSRSLRGVMLPAFSNISEDAERRERVFLETIRVVALVTMPMCILMIPAMPAAVRLVYSSRWDDAAPLMQIFLCTMGFAVLSGLGGSMIQSRGFYRRYLVMNIVNGVSFCALIWPAAAFGTSTTVALCVTGFYGISSLGILMVASTPSTMATKRHLLVATLLPFALSGIAALGGWGACEFFRWSPTDLRYAIVSVIIGGGVFLGLVRLFMNETLRSALSRVRGVLARRSRRNAEVPLA